MISSNAFLNMCLPAGFIIRQLDFVDEPLLDPLQRPALAKTRILGQELHLTLLMSLSEREKSVTLYHEILEAMTVASAHPPLAVQEFNEGDFERAAYDAHERFGPASPANLKDMLQFHGFQGK